MVTRIVSAGSLDEAQLDCWSKIQRSSPTLASPYFRPEYTRLIAAVRPDVRVGLLEAGNGPICFFPFQRGRFGLGAPVGWPITDYHGVIAAVDADVDMAEMLRACRLKTWGFRHVPAAQTAFEPFCTSRCDSAVINLTDGFAGYVEERRKSGSRTVTKLGQKERKLEREHGPVRYVEHTPDSAVLNLLMEWKVAQYRRTGAPNFLARQWVRKALRLMHEARGDAFAGLLSVLYVADNPVAMHFGIRSSSVLHSWYPTYHPSFSKYSPGQILFLKMAESVPQSGIRAIDLGPAEGQHKLVMKNSGAPLLEGRVEVPSLTAKAVSVSRRAEMLAKRAPLASKLRPVLRRLEAVAVRH